MQVVTRGDDGLGVAERGCFDVVITDLKLPGQDGMELVRRLHAAQPRLPIILMTAHGTTDTAIEATKQGAYDYLLKPFEMEEMIELVGRACDGSRFMTEPVELGPTVTGRTAIIGNSRQMQELCKEIGRVAAKPVTVLVRGERFPVCNRCEEEVRYKLLQAVPHISEDPDFALPADNPANLSASPIGQFPRQLGATHGYRYCQELQTG